MLASLLASPALAAEAGGDWPTYGHDSGGMRFSPLTQITPANVASLKPAWSYHLTATVAAPVAPTAGEVAQRTAEGVDSPAAPNRRRARRMSSQATPLVVDGLMYVTTTDKRVVALEPETGREVWAYKLTTDGAPGYRGVEYWPGDGKAAPQILFGTRDGLLMALDARTGKPAARFGNNGVVDLKTTEIMNGNADAFYSMTSPPIVYRNLVITGAMTQEFPTRGAAGDVRAWDVRTGRLAWTFHTVPRAGERGNDTWEGDSWKGRSGANVWGFMTVDAKRGIVYLPVGAPTWDRYGGDRKGANLYSSSIVALNAKTGRYRWHFQVVHHDIWDHDLEAPPTLIDVQRGSKAIPAVAVVSKSGMLFLFDRVNGKPIYDIEERAVPGSDAPGEATWPTQPFPVKPVPFARHSFSMADIATVTPELEAYCRKLIIDNKLILGGPYLPTGTAAPTVQFPGYQGGANWGGGSFDPTRSYYFVNANNYGQIAQNTIKADGSANTAENPVLGRFLQPETKMMCQQPPWGTLSAINVNTGEIAWQTTLGISESLPAHLQQTGRPNVGGSIATASGLVFIGAADDSRFRAFDAGTGRELWAHKLGAAAHATPITYLGKDGRQYVAIVGTGGSLVDSPVTDDSLNVFALP